MNQHDTRWPAFPAFKAPRTRRQFFSGAAGALAGGVLIPYVFTSDAEARGRPRAKNDRARIGAIGMRYQGSVIADKAQEYGDIVAICDVDAPIAEKAREQFGGKADIHEDYRAVVERPDIDVVTIGTPDHWHTAITLAACRADKDVYCEKPLTLTVDEGKLLARVVDDTGAVVQVGSWQRSDERFRLACELVRAGRIGKLRRVKVVLGKNKTGGPFPVQSPPASLNWDLWQGQTPLVPYTTERCHYTFRWWYEYSGGQMTDWGAHHLDIAHWAMGVDRSGPIEVVGRARFPNTPNGYNVAIDFDARLSYADGVEILVADHGRNGIMFEGAEGRIFVNREVLSGAPVEALRDAPLERDRFRLYSYDNLSRPPRAGKLEAIRNHMGNFFDCVRARRVPISDVVSQHRSATACHLANISMRLGRTLLWNFETEQFTSDDEADSWLSRPQRPPYQIV